MLLKTNPGETIMLGLGLGLGFGAIAPKDIKVHKVSKLDEALVQDVGEPTVNTQGAELYEITFYGARVGYAVKRPEEKIIEIKIHPTFSGIAKYAICDLGIDPSWTVKTANRFGNFGRMFPRWLALCNQS